jgi:PAS domain S-box-containing protein
MALTLSPYSVAFLVTAFISGATTLLAWRRRRAPGGLPLFLTMLAVTEWNLANAMEAASLQLADKILWSKVAYLGAHTAPALLFLFALAYTGRGRWITRRNLVLLFLIPAATIGLAATNEWHHLIWTSFTPVPGVYNMYTYGHGIWFWVATVYINSILFCYTFLMLRFALRSKEIYRYQVIGVIAASLFPWISFFVYLASLNPIPGLDLAAISFVFTDSILMLIILRWGFLDIIPVAREALIEEMADGMLVLDPQNRIVDINLAARRMLGSERGHWIGQRADAVLPEWPDLTALDHDKIEFTLHTPQVRYVDIRVSPLRQRNAELTGHLVVLRDITEHKQAQEALAAQNAELDAFAHTVAHDLKGPLAVIIGFNEMLIASHEVMSPQAQVDALHEMYHAGKKLDAIIEELMLLSGVRKQAAVLEPLDMGSVVRDVLDRLQVLIEEQSAQVTLPDTTAWPVAYGYAPWIEEVWANYISNAIQYGGRPLQVQLGATVQPNGQARFWVQDNGPGLSAEAQSELFAPFTRLAQVRAQGHGLGLSIVRRIVEKLGGQVGVESRPGQGSAFFFTLPLAVPPNAARGQAGGDSPRRER